ncbi:MAG: aminoglycoside 3'-phosphotransferase [Lachnospiraceae bacterium]|nr:aminoglycoside 3'-phosphotransferase [Lachnospiraceae bacterium]
MQELETSLPRDLKSLIAGKPYTKDSIGMSGSGIFLFEDMVLKVQKEDEETRSEAVMMKWLAGKLPVPEVLYHKVENGMNYLLMSKMPGVMSYDESILSDQELVTELLAEGLKKLWTVDISDCPQRWDLPVKLAVAEANVENGEVDVDNVEPETFGEGGFKDPAELLVWLKDHQPPLEPVLSHGDFCLPNIFVQNGKISGYIDLGKIGIADKWQDIALCFRSLKHNYNGDYGSARRNDFKENLLFEKLGIEPDWEKIRYYILLDELF